MIWVFQDIVSYRDQTVIVTDNITKGSNQACVISSLPSIRGYSDQSEHLCIVHQRMQN